MNHKPKPIKTHAEHPSKELLISLLLHDLQPSLQSLRFLAESFSANSHQMDQEKLITYGKELNMAIEELVQSSSAIFTWMEVQRQRFIPKPKAVALDRLLDDASNHFYRESPHYKVKIICNAPTDLVANTSNEALCIVLHQLLRNAAVQKKEGVILLEAWRQEHNTCIAVSDQGKGMSDRVAQNVQEHLNGNLNTPVLYRYGYRIIIRVLQLMNGKITFEKPASGGAKIIVTIPDM